MKRDTALWDRQSTRKGLRGGELREHQKNNKRELNREAKSNLGHHGHQVPGYKLKPKQLLKTKMGDGSEIS